MYLVKNRLVLGMKYLYDINKNGFENDFAEKRTLTTCD